MSANQLERIARQQAKALRITLELLSDITYLDSDGRELVNEIYRWLDHTKPIRKEKQL